MKMSFSHTFFCAFSLRNVQDCCGGALCRIPSCHLCERQTDDRELFHTDNWANSSDRTATSMDWEDRNWDFGRRRNAEWDAKERYVFICNCYSNSNSRSASNEIFRRVSSGMANICIRIYYFCFVSVWCSPAEFTPTAKAASGSLLGFRWG